MRGSSLVILEGREGDPTRARTTCGERDYKGLHAFPSNITRDDPPITRDFPPSLLILQGSSLTAGVVQVERHVQALGVQVAAGHEER